MVVPTLEEAFQNFIQEKVNEECETCKVKMFFTNKLTETVGETKWEEIKNIQMANLKGQTTVYFETKDKNYQLTADIRWYDQVVIADNNINHGSIINEGDLKTVEKDITFNNVPYIREAQKAHGMLARRSFQRGHFIDENFLKKPHIVKYGQPLKLILDSGNLSMTVSGKARGSGAQGDTIPVLITRTNKKVMAQIVDNTTVRME